MGTSDTGPRVVRLTRLVSKPGSGAELVERCRRIADRERAKHPDAYVVTQARQPLDDDRVEVLSITQWIDLGLMQSLMPSERYDEPAFWDELEEAVERWTVEVFEVTWTTEIGRTD